jgi:hypothetical protein
MNIAPDQVALKLLYNEVSHPTAATLPRVEAFTYAIIVKHSANNSLPLLGDGPGLGYTLFHPARFDMTAFVNDFWEVAETNLQPESSHAYELRKESLAHPLGLVYSDRDSIAKFFKSRIYPNWNKDDFSQDRRLDLGDYFEYSDGAGGYSYDRDRDRHARYTSSKTGRSNTNNKKRLRLASEGDEFSDESQSESISDSSYMDPSPPPQRPKSPKAMQSCATKTTKKKLNS